MSIISFAELLQGVKDKKIISAVMVDGSKPRFFIASGGIDLCTFSPNSRVSGRLFLNTCIQDITKINYAIVKDEAYKDKQKFKLIFKYFKLASKARFTNSFIKDCLALPSTFEQWVADGKKSLYDYHITTGNKIDGVVVTVDRICKAYPHAGTALRNAIQVQYDGSICSRTPFAGYEMSISSDNKDGFRCFLSLEFKGCGNGYYYLLINENTFIGYDVD